MKVTETELPGVLLIEPRVFQDTRGYFLETYHEERYRQAGIILPFVQDNVSFSRKDTLRGLHFQNPHAQGKLVYVLAGEVFDVAVDLGREAPTFGRWTGTLLSAENRRQIYVPPGFAHGFCVISDTALVAYKCTDQYHPQAEGSIVWNDPDIGIEWPVKHPLLNDKDRNAPRLKDIAPHRLVFHDLS